MQDLLDVTEYSHSSENPVIRVLDGRQPQRCDERQARATGLFVHWTLNKKIGNHTINVKGIRISII